MPSACVKSEKKPIVEVEDPLKQCINVIDKKVRNLQKRKGKLDEYKARVEGGAILNNDQKAAVRHYESVVSSLEFAKELQKQFQEIQEKAEKMLKKKLKYEQRTKSIEEMNRIQEILKLQSLLDSMGSETAREHFKSGKNGALVLSEEKLSQLDELYRLISVTRDCDKDYAQELFTASEHMVNYLDAQEKEVAGTTYKKLREMVEQIQKCGYFSNGDQPSEQESPEAAPASTETKDDAASDTAESEEATQEAEVSSTSAPVASSQNAQTTTAFGDEQTSQTSTQVQHQAQQQQQQQQQVVTSQPQAAPAQSTALAAGAEAEEETPFFAGAAQPTKTRSGFNEIMSGQYTFLQDSEIDSQQEAMNAATTAAHMDPAVVEARPMNTGLTQQAPEAMQHGYPTPEQSMTFTAMPMKEPVMGEQQVSVQDGLNSQQAASFHRDQAQVQSAQYNATSFEAQPPPSSDQSWGNAAEQSWTNNPSAAAAAEHASWADQVSQSTSWADQVARAPTQPTSWAGVSSGQGNMTSQLGPNPPAPIPMPSETMPGQSIAFGGDSNFSQMQSDDPNQLNPNANIFNVYGGGSGRDGGEYGAQSDMDSRGGRGSSKDNSQFGMVDQDGFQMQSYRNQRGGSRGMNSGGRSSRGSGGNYRGGRGGGNYGERRGGGYQQNGRGGGGQGRGGRGGPRSSGGSRGGSRGSQGQGQGGQGYGMRPSSGQ